MVQTHVWSTLHTLFWPNGNSVKRSTVQFVTNEHQVHICRDVSHPVLTAVPVQGNQPPGYLPAPTTLLVPQNGIQSSTANAGTFASPLFNDTSNVFQRAGRQAPVVHVPRRAKGMWTFQQRRNNDLSTGRGSKQTQGLHLSPQHHADINGKSKGWIIGDISDRHDNTFTPLNGSLHYKDQLRESIKQLWGVIKHPTVDLDIHRHAWMG